MKLHLGCGKVKLNDYLNIDLNNSDLSKFHKYKRICINRNYLELRSDAN